MDNFIKDENVLEKGVSWKIEGNFVTNILRQWFWEERKGYSKVREFFKSMVCDGSISEEDLDEVLKSILFCRKKLEDVNILTLVDDDIFNMEKRYIDSVIYRDKDLEKANNKIKEYSNVLEYLKCKVDEYTPKKKDEFYPIRKRLADSNFLDKFSMKLYGITEEMLRKFCKTYNLIPARCDWGMCSMIVFQDSNGNLLDAEDLVKIGAVSKECSVKEEKTIKVPGKVSQPWGWLSPTGEFWEGDFGEHEEVAYSIIEEKRFSDEFNSWDRDTLRLARDFLVYVKGYVLLHNPGGSRSTVVTYEKPFTKAQREFLYDYFMKEGNNERAESFFREY